MSAICALPEILANQYLNASNEAADFAFGWSCKSNGPEKLLEVIKSAVWGTLVGKKGNVIISCSFEIAALAR